MVALTRSRNTYRVQLYCLSVCMPRDPVADRCGDRLCGAGEELDS